MASLSEKELKHLVDVGNYSIRFDEQRQTRCAVSLYKYGSARQNFPDKVQALPTMERCIEKYKETNPEFFKEVTKKYKETKNTEYLLDAANYLMFEFMYPSIPDARFKPTDSEESAGIVGMSAKEIADFKNYCNNY